MNKHYNEIDIAKGIGIVLVVIGHGFPISPETIQISTNLDLMHLFIKQFIYGFHMALLFFVSGFVSKKILHLNTFHEKADYLKLRFQRLMIPYIALFFVYLPLKFLFSAWSNYGFNISNVVGDFFTGAHPAGQLWYLYSLFLMVVILALINQWVDFRIMAIVSCALFVINIYWSSNIQVIYRIMDNSIWFIAGILVAKYYCKILDTLKHYNIKVLQIICGGVYILIFGYWFLYGIKILDVFLPVLGIMGILLFSITNKDSNAKIVKGLIVCGKYTMDIYILSNFIQVITRIVFYNKLGINYEICFVLISIVGVIVPIFISRHIVRKSKKLRFLLLGI